MEATIYRDSCEPVVSQALYMLNESLLAYRRKEDLARSNKLSVNNLTILLSYIRNMSFGRIARRLKLIRNSSISSAVDHSYDLKSYDSYPDVRVAVYTCITGGYDELREPYYKNPNIDYYAITDDPIPISSTWQAIHIDPTLLDEVRQYKPNEINRFYKILPHRLFADYDVTIYIDGNIQLVTDVMPLVCNLGNNVIALHKFNVDCIYQMKDIIIAGRKASRETVKQQVQRYRKEGFPEHFGAFECNVIVRRQMDERCVCLMETWWEEFMASGSKRDQLSFPYALWKCGMDASSVSSLGPDVRLNPRLQVGRAHSK